MFEGKPPAKSQHHGVAQLRDGMLPKDEFVSESGPLNVGLVSGQRSCSELTNFTVFSAGEFDRFDGGERILNVA